MNICGDCTLCCKLLDIPWMNSPVNKYCDKCDIDKGCSIFKDVPKKCLDFNCAYRQMGKSYIDLRPDKCNIIFERVDKDIFIGLVNPDGEISNIGKQQIDSFLAQGFSVFLTEPGEKEPTVYITPNMEGSYVYNRVQEIIKERNGSS